MVRSKSVTFLCVTYGFAVAAGACSDENPVMAEACGAIEVGGCPGVSQATCDDPACTFVADCSKATGRWVPVSTCPDRVRDAGVGAGVDGGQDARAGEDATSPSSDGSSSAGCPPLQFPDCAEETRAACGAGCCGCEDLFRCESGAWEYRGPCVP